MKGVILGFEIAAGIVLFLFVADVLLNAFTSASLSLLKFQEWGQEWHAKHPKAARALPWAIVLSLIIGLVVWTVILLWKQPG